MPGEERNEGRDEEFLLVLVVDEGESYSDVTTEERYLLGTLRSEVSARICVG
jgi:hypothetical protein